METTTHHWKYLRNHCNIDDHTEKKCQKLHPKLNLKKKRKTIRGRISW